MKIRMTETMRGARDGHTVETFHAGETYDLAGSERSLDLAHVFIREGWAEEVSSKPPAVPKATTQEIHAAPTPPRPPAPPPMTDESTKKKFKR